MSQSVQQQARHKNTSNNPAKTKKSSGMSKVANIFCMECICHPVLHCQTTQKTLYCKQYTPTLRTILRESSLPSALSLQTNRRRRLHEAATNTWLLRLASSMVFAISVSADNVRNVATWLARIYKGVGTYVCVVSHHGGGAGGDL